MFESKKQTGTRKEPLPPFPAQHLEKPGLESKLKPRPKYEASDYQGSNKLKGKVALITGGDSGIGRAVAVLFAREGANVAITYLKEEETDADETLKILREEEADAEKYTFDVTSYDQCEKVIEKVVKDFGKIDILVNNAAFQQHVKEVEELSIDQWDKTFRTNIYGYFYMTKAALKYLPAGGCIVNTGSITGLEGSEDLLDYSATKGAIHAFTKSLAKKLLPKQIRVNCVAPGPVWTPLNPADQPAHKVAKFGADNPMKRPAQPEEIAPMFVFLASNIDSSFVTGQVMAIIGGETIAG